MNLFRFFWILLAAIIAFNTYLFFDVWDLPSTSWRVSQTAMAVEYMSKGGPLLAYEMPYFGPPWKMPLEFPLFQWSALFLVKAFNMSVEHAGKVAAFGYLLLTLIPYGFILRRLNVRPLFWGLFFSIFLSIPLVMTHSRIILIETSTVFFGSLFLSSALAYAQDRTRKFLILTILLGCVAALSKITTFIGFAIAAVFMLAIYATDLNSLWKEIKEIIIRKYGLLIAILVYYLVIFFLGTGKIIDDRSLLIALLLMALPFFASATYLLFFRKTSPITRLIVESSKLCIPPMLCMLIWLRFTGSVWKQTPFLDFFTGFWETIRWNFGFVMQRLDPVILKQLFWERPTENLFYHPVIYLGIFLGPLLVKEYRKHFLVSFTLSSLVILIFINLHQYHYYYTLENSVFLCAAVGFSLYALITSGKWKAWLGGVLALAIVGTGNFQIKQLTAEAVANFDWKIVSFAKEIENRTDPKDVLFIFGEWANPGIPYLTHRRSVMDNRKSKLTDEAVTLTMENLSKSEYRFGALVICAHELANTAENAKRMEFFQTAAVPAIDSGACKVYLKKTSVGQRT